jgi:hypothetical protein
MLAAASVAGCSDDGDDEGLLAALGQVRATDSTRGYVEYGDLTATRALLEADRQRFVTLTGFGTGRMRDYHKVVSEDLAFDPLTLRAAITAGAPPDWSAIIWGDYDLNAVNDRLAGLGVERKDSGGTTTWTSSADGDIRLSDPLVGIAGPGTLNNVRTAKGSFAFSPKSDTLRWVTEPGGDTLAQDPTMKTLAQCLGNVVAAIIQRNEDGPETLAVGVRAPSTSDVTDVVCVAPGSRDPNSVRDHLNDQLANGRSARTNRSYSELFPNAKVEVTGFPDAAVRLTANPGAGNPPGRPLQLLRTRDLNVLLGLR